MILAVLVIAVGLVLAWNPYLKPWIDSYFGPQAPIEVAVFEVSPSSIKMNQMAILRIEIVNTKEQSINLTIRLQTHNNVNISSAASLLPRTGENFTYQESLTPTMERVSLVFNVTGKIDVGDESRTYYINGYFFVPGLKAPIGKKTTLTVTPP